MLCFKKVSQFIVLSLALLVMTGLSQSNVLANSASNQELIEKIVNLARQGEVWNSHPVKLGFDKSEALKLGGEDEGSSAYGLTLFRFPIQMFWAG